MFAIMNSPIGEALLKVRTSNQWSLANAVAKKMGVSTAELEAFLCSVDDDELMRHGVWKQKVGKCFIVCTNPAVRRALENGSACNCGASSSTANEESVRRYFGSTDYNAGRHGRDVSKAIPHHATCSRWAPPNEGHLHSWRRGY